MKFKKFVGRVAIIAGVYAIGNVIGKAKCLEEIMKKYKDNISLDEIELQLNKYTKIVASKSKEE